MHIKPKDPATFVTPAPGAYNPESADRDVKPSAPKFSFGIKGKDDKFMDIPAPNAYSVNAVKLDKAPTYAFGIKHSPYLGTLKGTSDSGVVQEVKTVGLRADGARTSIVKEALIAAKIAAANNASSSNTVTNRTEGNTTSSTRVQTDGNRTRTETVTITKGPTITTSKSWTKQVQVAA